MFVYPKNTSLCYFLNFWHWQHSWSPWCKAWSLHVTSVIYLMLMAILIQNWFLPENKSHIIILQWSHCYLAKLYNIRLSQSVLVTTFFQFDSTKAAVSILLNYAHDFNKIQKILYSKLVKNKILIINHMMQDNIFCPDWLYLNYAPMNLWIANLK